jgi:hypothetical protein
VWHQSRDENTAQGRKIRLAAGMQRRGGQGKSGDAWRGARRGGGLAPTGRGQLGRRGTAGSGLAVARTGGTLVRTVARGTESLTSGARMVAGGRRERDF